MDTGSASAAARTDAAARVCEHRTHPRGTGAGTRRPPRDQNAQAQAERRTSLSSSSTDSFVSARDAVGDTGETDRTTYMGGETQAASNRPVPGTIDRVTPQTRAICDLYRALGASATQLNVLSMFVRVPTAQAVEDADRADRDSILLRASAADQIRALVAKDTRRGTVQTRTQLILSALLARNKNSSMLAANKPVDALGEAELLNELQNGRVRPAEVGRAMVHRAIGALQGMVAMGIGSGVIGRTLSTKQRNISTEHAVWELALASRPETLQCLVALAAGYYTIQLYSRNMVAPTTAMLASTNDLLRADAESIAKNPLALTRILNAVLIQEGKMSLADAQARERQSDLMFGGAMPPTWAQSARARPRDVWLDS